MIPILNVADEELLPSLDEKAVEARPRLQIDLVLLAKRREIARRREQLAESNRSL